MQKKCNFQFTRLTSKVQPPEIKAKVIELYNHGLSIRAAARINGVSSTDPLNSIREFAKKIYQKAVPGSAIIMEIDKMLHYSGSKKNKLWIWKAYKREMDELMDWECGGRDKETLSWLVERLSKWNVKMFCANNHAAYCEVLDEDKLFKVNLKHFILSKITAARDTGMRVLEENPQQWPKLWKWWILQWRYLQDFM